MSDSTSYPGREDVRSVTAFFDARGEAEKAKTDLMAIGVPAESITIVASDSDHFTVAEDHHQGFWQSLTNFFMPDDDRRVYAEGLRRGGFALSVKTDDTHYDRAIDVLDRDGAVDLDERETDWASEGWSRSQPGSEVTNTAYRPPDNSTAGFGGSYAGEDGIAAVDEATNPDVRERIGVGIANQVAATPTGGPQTYGDAASPATDAAADAATGRPMGQDLFGRRDLSHGRARVRSYIVGE